MQSEEILQLIARSTCELAPALSTHTFRREDRLAELGLHSVDRAEVLIAVLEALSLTIPLAQLSGPQNLGELADLLQAKVDGR